MLRTIPRTVVGVSLTAARWPVDRAFAIAGVNGSSTASARDIAGVVLRDEALRHDAAQRRAAAKDRGRSQRLRDAAEAIDARADERLEEREQQAERTRRESAANARKRERAAERRRKAKEARAEQEAAARKQEAAEKAERAEASIDEDARRGRLEALEEKAEALEEREDALVAADEAKRLRRAAENAKAERKRRR